MTRRTFLELLAIFGIRAGGTPALPAPKQFVAATQYSPLPAGPSSLRDTVDEILRHGFNGLEYPFELPAEEAQQVLEYAQSRGMSLICQTEGMELFGRDKPPAVSVFSSEYSKAVRKKVEDLLRPLAKIERVDSVFCYQDEPFHSGPQSFDLSDAARAEFKKRYGYDLPSDLESIRNHPSAWLDVLNFQSDCFPAGWRQVYRIIKEIDPRFRVVMTHDSHSTFGAGAGSNAKLAMDDVFHWGGDFADMFVFDIYPYMMFDFRYGQYGKLPKPRISQMHYAFGQMRNLTRTYGKDLGFWFGTYNPRWFRRYLNPERRAQFWSEREMTYTAVAQGADFLLSGLKIPEDVKHWEQLGEGLRLLQKVGPSLVNMPKVKAKACFLFPRTQYLLAQEEYWNVGLSYELLLRAFGELEVLHEEQIRDDRLEGYELLALCDVKILPRAVAGRIAEFVRRGGAVIADCVPQGLEKLFGVENPATHRVRRTGVWSPRVADPQWFVATDSEAEEANPPRDRVEGRVFGRYFRMGVVSPRPARPTSGRPLLRSKSGAPALIRKGQAFLLGFCVQDSYFQTWRDGDTDSRENMRDLLRAITEAAGVRSHVYSSNADIEASLRAGRNEGYLFVINHEAATPETTVSLAGLEVGAIVDVASGRSLPFQKRDGVVSVTVEAPQSAPRLLHLSPKKLSADSGRLRRLRRFESA